MRISNDVSMVHQNNLRIQKAKTLSGKDMGKLQEKDLKEVSKEFASMFINEVYKSMRKTVDKTSLLDKGKHTEMFEDMLYTEYSRMTANQGSVGLGKMVYDYLKRSS